MDNTIKSYLRSSKIDYLSHFGQAWIGFNSWYDQNGSGRSEWLRIKRATNNSLMRKHFITSLQSLNTVDPFIVREVESLSTCKCKDYTYKLDTSGFRFRLECTNGNTFTSFLKNACRLRALQKRSYGLLFFKDTNQKDVLFKKLYTTYAAHMATPVQMANEYDATNITKELLAIGIDHYGELLHHDLTKRIGNSIYTIDNVFGKNYVALCDQLIGITSVNSARNSGFEDQYRCKGFDIFERYMYLLYSFRCAYFHGSLDPKNEIAQVCAQHALSGIRELMGTLK